MNPLPHTLGVWYVRQGYMRCQRCRVWLQPSVCTNVEQWPLRSVLSYIPYIDSYVFCWMLTVFTQFPNPNCFNYLIFYILTTLYDFFHATYPTMLTDDTGNPGADEPPLRHIQFRRPDPPSRPLISAHFHFGFRALCWFLTWRWNAQRPWTR